MNANWIGKSCLVIVFMVLAVITIIYPVAAQDEIQESTNTSPVKQDLSGSLVVPVYPRFKQKEGPVSIESLKDNYIVLDDGSVMSMADWVLGSLKKSDIGAGMSDYESRLFLGQVARAAVGMKQDLIYRSFEDAGKPIPYTPHKLPAPLQAAQGFLTYFIPALAPNWSPAAKEFSFKKHAGFTGHSGAILFDRQFFESLDQTRDEFVETGLMLNVINTYENETPAKPK